VLVVSAAWADNTSQLLSITTSYPNPDVSRKGPPNGSPVTAPAAPVPLLPALPPIGGTNKDTSDIKDNDSGQHHQHFNGPSVVVVPYGTIFSCVESSVMICGRPVLVPASAIGTTVALSVPAPYQHQPFAARCDNYNGYIGYQIVDNSNVTCSLQVCPASNVSLCGAQIPVPAGINEGSKVDVQIPAKYLSTAAFGVTPTFTAQCVENETGAPVYQISDSPQVDCNIFPCPDSKVRLCDTDIPITGSTPIGGVANLRMPSPFAPDPFTVECVGSGGNAPTYQLIDHSAVSCGMTH
jgi:hypothetical protein